MQFLNVVQFYLILVIVDFTTSDISMMSVPWDKNFYIKLSMQNINQHTSSVKLNNIGTLCTTDLEHYKGNEVDIV